MGNIPTQYEMHLHETKSMFTKGFWLGSLVGLMFGLILGLTSWVLYIMFCPHYKCEDFMQIPAPNKSIPGTHAPIYPDLKQ